MLELSAQLRGSIIVNALVNGHGPVATNVSTESLANHGYTMKNLVPSWNEKVE